VAERSLLPGSYVAELALDGHATVRYPVLLARGERFDADVPLLRREPDGFVYVPAGRFLFGDPRSAEELRAFHSTVPMHERRIDGFLIARHETTYADWLVYLAALPADERVRRLPGDTGFQGGVKLSQEDGGWVLALQPSASSDATTAREGDLLRYAERDRRAAQDWSRFPVAGISWDDANAYVAWLRTSGRVAGARLCREDEWERAARGADARMYSHGDVLEPDDANFDRTYERRTHAFGPDEVGSHLASRSPFGIDDLVGNVFEMTHSVLEAGGAVARGGAYYFDDPSATVTNRLLIEPNLRNPTLGFRVCADLPD
jgi:formylglycine-generating enzyme required for sulfatase activity